GNPGVVVADGEIVATWRARARGQRLEVTVSPLTGRHRPDVSELEAEATRTARARGLDRRPSASPSAVLARPHPWVASQRSGWVQNAGWVRVAFRSASALRTWSAVAGPP